MKNNVFRGYIFGKSIFNIDVYVFRFGLGESLGSKDVFYFRSVDIESKGIKSIVG